MDKPTPNIPDMCAKIFADISSYGDICYKQGGTAFDKKTLLNRSDKYAEILSEIRELATIALKGTLGAL